MSTEQNQSTEQQPHSATGGKGLGSANLYAFMKEVNSLSKSHEFARVLGLLQNAQSFIMDICPRIIQRMDKYHHQQMADTATTNGETKSSRPEEEDEEEEEGGDEHPMVQPTWAVKVKSMKQMLEFKDSVAKIVSDWDKDLQQRVLAEFQVWHQEDASEQPDVYRFVDTDLVTAKDHIETLNKITDHSRLQAIQKLLASDQFYEAVVVRKTKFHLYVRTICNSVITGEPVEFEIKAAVLLRRRSRESVAKLKDLFYQHLASPPKEPKAKTSTKKEEQKSDSEGEEEQVDKKASKKRKRSTTSSSSSSSSSTTTKSDGVVAAGEKKKKSKPSPSPASSLTTTTDTV